MAFYYILIIFLSMIVLVGIKEFLAVIWESRESPRINNEIEEDSVRNYVLNVSKVHEDGGVFSNWYGWNDQWLFTHKEAIDKKAEIKHLYDEVEILENDVEQDAIKNNIKLSTDSDI